MLSISYTMGLPLKNRTTFQRQSATISAVRHDTRESTALDTNPLLDGTPRRGKVPDGLRCPRDTKAKTCVIFGDYRVLGVPVIASGRSPNIA